MTLENRIAEIVDKMAIFDAAGVCNTRDIAKAIVRLVGDWKPIEAAPKDPEATFLVCAIGDDRRPFVVRADIMWQARKAGTPSHLGLSHLTHWMPLPAMPTA